MKTTPRRTLMMQIDFTGNCLLVSNQDNDSTKKNSQKRTYQRVKNRKEIFHIPCWKLAFFVSFSGEIPIVDFSTLFFVVVVVSLHVVSISLTLVTCRCVVSLVPVGCRVMHQDPSVGLNGWLPLASFRLLSFSFQIFLFHYDLLSTTREIAGYSQTTELPYILTALT